MRRAALGALLLILPLTLGLRSVDQSERRIDTGRLAADAASSLSSDGWSARPQRHHLIGPLIEGARGECRILVHFIPPEGVSDDKFQRIARPIGPVTYHYRGQVSRDFPRLVPMLQAHGQRYARSFGVNIPTAPPVAIARSPSCGEQAPDFTGLRQYLEA